MSRFSLPTMLVAGALAVGCAGTIDSDGFVTAEVYTPDLVYVSPGVSVIADYDEPVFYSNNYYWRTDSYGRWYSSPYYDRGWSYAYPPAAVLSIGNPYAYRHYRPYGYYNRGYYNRNYHRSYNSYNRNYNRGRYNGNYNRDHRGGHSGGHYGGRSGGHYGGRSGGHRR